VEGEQGIKVTCEEVSCIFEFIPYKFVGEDRYVEKAPIDNSRVAVLSHDSKGNMKVELRDVTANVGGMSAAVGGVATAVSGVAAAVGGVAAAMGDSGAGAGAGAASPAAVRGITPIDPAPQDHGNHEEANPVTNQREVTHHNGRNSANGDANTGPSHASDSQLPHDTPEAGNNDASNRRELHHTSFNSRSLGNLSSPEFRPDNSVVGGGSGAAVGNGSGERVARGVAKLTKTKTSSSVKCNLGPYTSEV
jgi:hypothetical protein